MSKRTHHGGAPHKTKILRETFLYQLFRLDTTTHDLVPVNDQELQEFETKHPYIAARWKTAKDGQLAWQAQCQTILKNLMQLKLAKPFLDPVDPHALGLHDYFNVVKEPMDLGTVHRHLVGGLLATPADLQRVVHLCFDNAMLYNPPGNFIHEDARKLKGIFDRKFLLVRPPDEPAAAGAPIESSGAPISEPAGEAAGAEETSAPTPIAAAPALQIPSKPTFDGLDDDGADDEPASSTTGGKQPASAGGKEPMGRVETEEDSAFESELDEDSAIADESEIDEGGDVSESDLFDEQDGGDGYGEGTSGSAAENGGETDSVAMDSADDDEPDGMQLGDGPDEPADDDELEDSD